MHKLQLIFLFFFIYTSTVISQKTEFNKIENVKYRDARELFEKEKYGAAQKLFKEVIQIINDKKNVITADALFYSAVCGVELYNKDAEYELIKFISQYPENSKVNAAWLKLGCFQYNLLKYNLAIESFEKVDIYDLSHGELTEYYFKKGYSHFIKQENEKAKKCFAELKDGKSRFSSPANYYYAHILYTEKNYQGALLHFEKLTADENFGKIVPYYITQIYYLQGKYEELLKIAPELLKNSIPKRIPEIARLIGDSYYKTNHFTEAIPYLKLYMEKTTNKVEREDNYQLGFTYYKAGICDTAIKELSKVLFKDDSLAQNAQYHLGDCYVKLNQKKAARTAFYSAYKLDFDKIIKEDALFQYAKLCKELSYNPYNEAIDAFNKYIKEYPKSSRIDEANNYLVNIYLTTKNYKDALNSIENIKKKDTKTFEAYQRILYNRAVELYNEGKTENARELFVKAIENDYNDAIVSSSCFWIGESYYKLKDYENALKYFKKFQLLPGAFSLTEYNLSNYNMGYLYFNDKNYKDALIFFKKFDINIKNEGIKLTNDALLRTGDCYFINKEYGNAVEYYNKAIALNQPDIDYALYQKGLCLGAQGKFDEKINVLQLLLKNHKKSSYIAATYYEIANTYLILDNNEKALQYFESVNQNYPNSSFAKDAMLKTGMINYNLQRNELAIQILERVIEKYPGTNTAKDALVTMKNIYVSMDRVDDFIAKVKTYPSANVSNTEEDSITYIAAENRYMEGDCQKALTGFTNYLSKFPEGFFTVPAHFYKAECNFKAGIINEALSGYEYVLSTPKSKFSEKALLNSAEISFRLKQYEKALNYYTQLDTTAEYNNNIITARIGMMRCNYLLNKFDSTVSSSYILLNTPKISGEINDEAHLTISRAALAMDSITLAQSEYTLLLKSKNGEISSEANYQLAFIQFKSGNYQKAESIIYEYISNTPSSEFWLAKLLILWADIYVKQGNLVQAKATLQSIIDKYEGPELVKIAKDKYNEILLIEKEENNKSKEKETKKEDDIKINLDVDNQNINNNF